MGRIRKIFIFSMFFAILASFVLSQGYGKAFLQISSKQTYFEGEEIRLSGIVLFDSEPLQNFILNVSVFSENFSIEKNVSTDLNGSFEFTMENLSEGKYFVKASGEHSGIFFENSTEFEVKKPEELENFSVLEFDLTLEKEKYLVNEDVVLLIFGKPRTNLTLEVISPTNSTFFVFTIFLNESGNVSQVIRPSMSGRYEMKLRYMNETITKYFDVEERKVECKIFLEKKKFEIQESVNITIFGSSLTEFLLEVKTPLTTEIYNFSTDEEGKFFFEFIPKFSGNYTIRTIYNNSYLAEESFEVIKEEIKEEELSITLIELEQKEATIGLPVKWMKKMLIKNKNSMLVNVSTFSLPKEATNIVVVLNGSVISNNTPFCMEILPNSSSEFLIFYQTPAPFKVESETFFENLTFLKTILFSSNSSVTYTNVRVFSKFDENLRDLRLFKEEEDVTLEEFHNFTLIDSDGNGKVDLAEWKVPVLRSINYTIKGSLRPLVERNVFCEGCVEGKIPAGKTVNLTIRFGFPLPLKVADYFSSDWILMDVNGGNATNLNETHKKIEWKIEGNEIWYLLNSPNKTSEYIFETEIFYENFSFTQHLIVKVFVPTYVNGFAMMAESNKTYTLKEDLVVEKSGILIKNVENVSIDCNFHLIKGTNFGIIVLESKNVEIKNCKISGFKTGIFSRSSNATLRDIELENNENGAVFINSTDAKIYNLTSVNNEFFGLLFLSSFNVSVENSSIKNKFSIKTLNEIENMEIPAIS